MRVEVTFRGLQSSQSVKEYAVDKIGRLTRFLVKPISAETVLTKDGRLHIAEVLVFDSGETLAAKETSEDIYAALDAVVDKLARQARRHKERVKNHRAASTSGVIRKLEAEASRRRSEDLDAELDALEE